VGGVVADVWSYPTMFRVVPLGFLLVYLAFAIPARRSGATRPVSRKSEA
jgi:hypothetical protein